MQLEKRKVSSTLQVTLSSKNTKRHLADFLESPLYRAFSLPTALHLTKRAALSSFPPLQSYAYDTLFIFISPQSKPTKSAARRRAIPFSFIALPGRGVQKARVDIYAPATQQRETAHRTREYLRRMERGRLRGRIRNSASWTVLPARNVVPLCVQRPRIQSVGKVDSSTLPLPLGRPCQRRRSLSKLTGHKRKRAGRCLPL